MKRYLIKGWIYSKILDGKKLLLLGSFLLFYVGLAFNFPDLSTIDKNSSGQMGEKICLEENTIVKPTH